MKHRILTYICVTTLFAALAVPIWLGAQGQQQTPPNYTVTDLGTLGGTMTYPGEINNNGEVTGASTLPGDTVFHAFLWKNGEMTDLGTLGGPNSAAGYRPSESGVVGGWSEISTPDPNGEDWCGFGTYNICRPFMWRDGVMRALPTLGGNNGQAFGANSQGQVAGQVEYNATEPGYPSVFLRGAVVWQNGKIQKVLHPLPGDTSAGAYAINDRGQAIGCSGPSAFTWIHPVLWQNGTVTDLGSFGGRGCANDINNQGQIVGYSFLPGSTDHDAFLWQNGVMKDLGTLPGDTMSTGEGINSKGQVVGGSGGGPNGNRAILWQNGVMWDLNTLVPADSPLYLLEAWGAINDRGQIVCFAYNMSTGEYRGALLTPTTQHWPRHGCPKIDLPDNVREQVERHMRHGYEFVRPQGLLQ
jgi:probable HAF family extracellular repeat protein